MSDQGPVEKVVKRVPKHVLILEDSFISRKYLCDAARAAGCMPDAVGHPKLAIKKIMSKKKPYSLFILDHYLPVKNGLDLLKDFKKVAPDLPIIIVTTEAVNNSKVFALTNGAVHYTIKPFTKEQMAKTIRQFTVKEEKPST